MLITTGTAVRYHTGKLPMPIRWVLAKAADGSGEVAALLSIDLELNPLEIINYFIRRWTMEVTFEEAKAHLGVEAQRQWSELAIARTTPMLLGLFGLVTLWAESLQSQNFITHEIYRMVSKTTADILRGCRFSAVPNMAKTETPHVYFCG